MKASIRTAVYRRAGDACEGCSGPLDDASIDHFFGRKNAQEELATLWLLCFKCHRAKTENRASATSTPDARVWVGRFMVFAALHGYAESVKRCQLRLEWISAKGKP